MFLLSYRNTRESFGEQEMLLGHEPQASVSTAFWSSPNFHECFYYSIKTQITCFLFLLENTVMQKRKSTCLLWSSKCKFSLLTPSLSPQLMLVFYWVIETWFKTNQHAYLLWVFFLKCNSKHAIIIIIIFFRSAKSCLGSYHFTKLLFKVTLCPTTKLLSGTHKKN